jgi:hypothetical protein
MSGKLGAYARSSMPVKVHAMPITSEYGSGRRSVNVPTTGWSSEAVNWEVSVIAPIWAKSRPWTSLKIGYAAGIADCSMSLRRWQKLTAASTRNAARPWLGGGMGRF